MNKISKRNNGRKTKQPTRGLQKITRSITLASKMVNRQVNLQANVYAIYNFALSQFMYSFNSSATQASPTLYYNIATNLVASTEFTQLTSAYNIFRFKGISIQPSNSLVNTNLLNDLPPVYFQVAMANSTTSIQSDMTAKADAAIENKLTSTMNTSASIYYSLPPVLVGPSSNVVGGSQAWCTSSGFTAPSLYAILGYLNSPQFVSLAAGVSQRVCVLNVVCDVDFASPTMTP